MLGDRDDPYIKAPKNWPGCGLPYAAWCRCAVCGILARCILIFDFYADNQGDLLTCDNCMTGSPMSSDISNMVAEIVLKEEKEKMKSDN